MVFLSTDPMILIYIKNEIIKNIEFKVLKIRLFNFNIKIKKLLILSIPEHGIAFFSTFER